MARDVTKLHPFLQLKIKELIKLCDKYGLKIGISDCVRTVQEQDALYAKGRTDKSSGIVTNCKGISYSSNHQWCIAFDFYRNDGKGAYNDLDGFFGKVGKIAESIGLEWGGSWKTFKDKPHIQLKTYGTSAHLRLKRLYINPSKYIKTFSYVPVKTITNKSSKTDVLWLQERLSLVGLNVTVDGCFGSQTSNAIVTYWKQLGWKIADKNGNKYYSAGKKTIKALSEFRMK